MCVVSYKTFDVDCSIASFPASFRNFCCMLYNITKAREEPGTTVCNKSQGGAWVLQYVTQAREEPGAWVLQYVTQAREEPGYSSM